MPKRPLSFVLFAALMCAGLAPRADEPVRAEAGRPIQLFDGSTLSGWTFQLVDPNLGMEDVWSVRDGAIVCKGEPLGYLRTRDSFTSFRLVVEWRWAPDSGGKPPRVRNSGVLMRINGEPRGIPRAYEAQLWSGDAGDVYGFWGMKVAGDPARQRSRTGDPMLGDMSGVAKIEGAEKPIGEWNRYEIVLDGTKLTVSVNGKHVNDATVGDVLPGPIGLQSEGGEIQFRKVELTPLP